MIMELTIVGSILLRFGNVHITVAIGLSPLIGTR